MTWKEDFLKGMAQANSPYNGEAFQLLYTRYNELLLDKQQQKQQQRGSALTPVTADDQSESNTLNTIEGLRRYTTELELTVKALQKQVEAQQSLIRDLSTP